jgi:hypothetical protein
VLEILGEIHGRHAAGAELALDAIAVGEGVLETNGRRGFQEALVAR